MTEFLQQCINALALGGTYALLALGVALIFSILGLINFAHGELMTIAGYTVFFSVAMGLPFPLVVLFALLAGGAAGVLMERIAFRPVRGASPTTLLVTSFVVSLLLQVIFQNLISARPRAIAVPSWLDGTLSVGALNIGRIQLASVLIVLLAAGVLTLLLQRTTIGIAMRAATSDFWVTRLMGIRANAIISTAFAISGVLAALAGVLWVAQRGSVDPLMGFMPVLKAFIAVVIGGMGSLVGAAIGGFVLGTVEVFMQVYLPTSVQPYRDVLVLLVVITVLMVRPSGLFARVEEVKV